MVDGDPSRRLAYGMPWQHCGKDILDNQTCPDCGYTKEQWTVEWQKTRRLVVGGRVLKLLLVDGAEEGVPGEPYCITKPDGTAVEETLNEVGYAKLKAKGKALYAIEFPGWAPGAVKALTPPGPEERDDPEQFKRFAGRKQTFQVHPPRIETGVAYAGSFDHGDGAERLAAARPTVFAPVLDKVYLHLAYMTGTVPPAGHLLAVTLDEPRDDPVELVVEFTEREPEHHKLLEGSEVGKQVVLLLIHGALPRVDHVTIPGVQVIDVSEDTFLGFAPYVTIGGKRVFAQELLPETDLYEVPGKPEEAPAS
jgi:hypothetical protein